MITILLILLPLVVAVGMVGYYGQLSVIQQEQIIRQTTRLERQAEEIAELRRKLATSEAVRAEMFDLIQNSADVVRGRDCQIAQLRGLIALGIPTWRRN